MFEFFGWLVIVICLISIDRSLYNIDKKKCQHNIDKKK